MEDFTRELTPGNTKAAMKLSKEVRELLVELLQGLKPTAE